MTTDQSARRARSTTPGPTPSTRPASAPTRRTTPTSPTSIPASSTTSPWPRSPPTRRWTSVSSRSSTSGSTTRATCRPVRRPSSTSCPPGCRSTPRGAPRAAAGRRQPGPLHAREPRPRGIDAAHAGHHHRRHAGRLRHRAVAELGGDRGRLGADPVRGERRRLDPGDRHAERHRPRRDAAGRRVRRCAHRGERLRGAARVGRGRQRRCGRHVDVGYDLALAKVADATEITQDATPRSPTRSPSPTRATSRPAPTP